MRCRVGSPARFPSQSNPTPTVRRVFTHGLAHQLNLVDLYAHPGVVFPRPYVDEWDNMAGLFTNVHFLAWSKQRAAWITAHGSQIQYIIRAWCCALHVELFLQESTAQNRKAIAIGLTQGLRP